MKNTILSLLFTILIFNYAHADVDMTKIAMIESSGNPSAYNSRSGATGLFQITKICLADYNNLHKSKYSMDDLWNTSVNTEIATWYMNIRIPKLLRHYKKADTLENRLIAYNCGVGCIGKELPIETVRYIEKYKNEKN